MLNWSPTTGSENTRSSDFLTTVVGEVPQRIPGCVSCMVVAR